MQHKMWKKAKRVFAGLLAVAMVMTSMPLSNVSADETSTTANEKVWNFADASFTGGGYTDTNATYTYDGLSFTGGKSHNDTYLYMGAGSISVPVEGNSTITVKACYQYSFYFKDNTEGSVDKNTGSTSQIDEFSYNYVGEAGTVTITTLGTSYINSIHVAKASGETTTPDTSAPETPVVSENKTWTFTDAAFTGGGYDDTTKEYTYDGLTFTGGKSHNGTYLYMGTGSILVPVAGDSKITVKSCYQYSYYFEKDTEASVGVNTGSTSQIDEFVYNYEGEAGTVKITTLGTSYINSIQVEKATAPDTTVPDTNTPEESKEPTVPASEKGKIDVWDFGVEELDTTQYVNKLSVDLVNSWYGESVAPGTKGVALPAGTHRAGELFLEMGGKTNNRYRTTNTAISRHDEKSLQLDGVTYNGYFYSNTAGVLGEEPVVYLGIEAKAGDILTLIVSSNGNDSLITMENMANPGVVVEQENYVSSNKAQKMTFYVPVDGTYKIYSANEKLVVARLYKESTNAVTVSGSVTAPAALSDYSVVFTNQKTGVVTTAAVENGAYTASLNDQYTYDVTLGNANGYVIESAAVLTLEKNAAATTFDVEVASVDLVAASGSIVGMDADTLKNIAINLKADTIYVPEVTIEGTEWSAKLEKNIEYTVEVSGLGSADYTLKNPATIKATDVISQDITFEAKPVYAVTINLTGATAADLAEADFIFTNLNEDGYVYTFKGTEDIQLRDGTYVISVENSGAFVQKLTSNLVVKGAAVTKEIAFNSDITEWVFTDAAFAKEPYLTSGEHNYQGLKIVNGGNNKNTYLLMKAGSISVPVKGDCTIMVNSCYQYSFYFADETEKSVGVKTGSTGQIDTYTYDYKGEAGYVDITVLGTSYINSIKVVEPIPYKETVTVGATGCDYTTINDALEAVRVMDRTADQRVTISILPGNYEEMLVIDVDNVTLKNASTAPSIETKDKGVNIDANAVRITSYYGHGYTYYSMGKDCKYDAELLAVNKENGYASFENPGTGTTSGSYWNATVVVYGDGFEADGIIFENSFNQYVSAKAADDVIVALSSAKEPADAPRAGLKEGSVAVQDKKYVERAAALAIADNCKEVSFDNCKFIGRQDTLYGGTGVTAAFYDCAVYGGTDYIFGPMTAVFAKCDLVFNTSEDKNDVGYITAAQTKSGYRGMLMYNCTVTSTIPGVDTASEYTSKPGYLGRPWAAATGEAVFYNTVIEASDSHWYETSPSLIQPAGWLSSLSGESVMSAEYGTYEMAKDVDNQSARASWATTTTEPKLADGTEISVKAFLGDWDAFAGKDMEIKMPTEKVDNKPVEDTGAEVKTYTFDATTLTAAADKEAIEEGTKLGDYFKVIGKVVKRTSSSTGKVTSIELEKAAKGSLQFTVEGTADVVIGMSSTGGSNTSAVALLDASGKVVANKEGLTTVSGTSATTLTYKGLAAGTYSIVSPEDANYNRGARVLTIKADDSVAASVTVNEYSFDPTTLTAAADKEAIAEGTKLGDYFTVIGKVVKRISSSTGKVTSIELEKAAKGSLQFTVEGTADVVIGMSSTGGSNTSAVALLDASGKVVANKEGITTVSGTSATTLTYKGLAAGTYSIVSPEDANYNRGARVLSLEATDTVSAAVTIKEYAFDATALTAAADKEAIAEGTTLAENFTSMGSVTKRISSSTGKVTSIELGKALSGSVQFVVGGTADVVITMSSTGGSNTSPVGLVDASGKLVANKEGVTTVTGTSKTTMTYEGLTAGTYKVVSPEDANYGRGARLYTIEMSDLVSGSRPPRADWASVAAPVIESVALNKEDANVVDVVVKALIGYDGADKVTVSMLDEAGKVVATANSAKDGDTHAVTFEPAGSGKYTFTVVAIREDEADKECVEKKTLDFTLPLVAPNVKGAYNVGGGNVEVSWDAVKEAEKYVVSVDGKDVVTTTELSAVVEGLEAGKTYSIVVAAIRGEERVEADALSKKVVDEVEIKWYFAAYGSSTNKTDNGYEVNEDGSVRVYSNNGKGKIVPGSTDGIAFYYTEIDPETTNFTLSATAVVNNWKLSNGQEGFGLMAADRVGTHGDATAFWNNCYMALASKVEYYADANGNVAQSGSKFSMKLGIGAQEKVGVTADNLADFDASKTDIINANFISTTTTLENSCAEMDAGTYNIIGNYIGTEPTGTVENPITEVKFTIQKNNTGYFVSYTDASGKTTTQKYYDTEALNQLEEDAVYLGFFASRNADITFKDITYTTISPEEDAPAEERPIQYIQPSYKVTSSKVANSTDYELTFIANADGSLLVECKDEILLLKDDVKADEKVSLDTKVGIGETEFIVTFYPDKNYVPGEYQQMTSYEPKTIKHIVKHMVFGEEGDTIYVSPDAEADGNGTKEKPLNIYTAVTYAQPGQTIVLENGVYDLSATVTIQRGIDGTAEKPIKMIGESEVEKGIIASIVAFVLGESDERPVFDFGGNCAGMIFAGDYWYFKGFDVTNSADAQKGIQVSGNYNVLDQINTYNNGNTGIQISRYLGTDLYEDWPAYNTILNCTSYNNADKGYEDADGFAAKLTVADGNVFDGCIAYNNADDGWDLFAKVQTGSIGAVTIRNCVAYENGYVVEDGKLVNAGNGNGFKMGGDSMAGGHIIENSVAFFNKAKGIDSNSCPDIKVYNCATFNNGSYNIALYTNTAEKTDYVVDGLISYRTENKSQEEQLKLKGQDAATIQSEKNFYWDAVSTSSMNSKGVKVSESWFESLEFTGISRNADGTIDMNGFLVVTEECPVDVNLNGTASGTVVPGEDTDGDIVGGGAAGGGSSDSDVTQPEEDSNVSTPSTPDKTEEEASSESTSTGAQEETTGTVEVVIPVGGTVAEKTEAIVEAIESVKAGQDVVIKVVDAESGNAEISIEVLTSLEENKGKKTSVVVELANGFTWTIDGSSVKTSALAEGISAINMWVEIVENVVPAELVKDVVTEEQTAIEISIKHDGEFGFTADLGIPVGEKFAGKFATLYYNNTETNTLDELVTTVVDMSGKANYSFSHASDYVIVIDEAAEDVVETEKVEATESVVETEKAETEAPAAEGGSNTGMLIGIIAIIILIGVAAIIFVKKKFN